VTIWVEMLADLVGLALVVCLFLVAFGVFKVLFNWWEGL
jgi:hypothetical protein